MSDLSSPPSLEDLFPTHGAIEERQQIGREDTIAALVQRIRDHGDALLLEPRKEGKTTVASAAVRRIAAEGGVVAVVDCTDASVRDASSLARAILTSLRSSGVVLSRTLEARDVAARRGPRGRRKAREAATAAEKLGVEEATAFGALAELIPRLNEVTLDEVFEKLVELGATRTVCLFLDEIQTLAVWDDTQAVQEALARFLRRGDRRVSFLAAGSDRTATERLFADRQPLHWEFEPFALPPIDRVDWHRGIVERFEAAGHPISAELIDKILAATAGHPHRTMAVAKQTLRETREAGEGEVHWAAVDAAIEQARKHPSWNS